MFGRFLKKSAIMLVILMVTFGFSGCNRSASGQITLYWWRSKFDAPVEILRKIADKYEQSHSNIKIEIVLPDSEDYDSYKLEAKNALASWKTVQNAPDILSVRAQDLPEFATTLYPAPAKLFDSLVKKNERTGDDTNSYVKKLFYPIVSKSMILVSPQDNKPYVYGLPMAIDTMATYVNTDLFKEAIKNVSRTNSANNQMTQEQIDAILQHYKKPPKTWKDLVDLIPLATTKTGNDVSIATIPLGTAENVERSYDILQTIMEQNGTTLNSDDYNSATFNLAPSGTASDQSNGLKAFNFYLQFANPQSNYYSWNSNMPDSLKAFGEGKSIMLAHYASSYSFLVNDYPNIKQSIDAVNFPQIVDPDNKNNSSKIKTAAQMWAETATNAKGDSNRQTEAWKFIYYITSQEGVTNYLKAMQMPSALKSVEGNSRLEAFNDASAYADTWYKGSDATKVDLIFAQMVSDAQSGKKTPAAALDQAAIATTKILKSSPFKFVSANNLNAEQISTSTPGG